MATQPLGVPSTPYFVGPAAAQKLEEVLGFPDSLTDVWGPVFASMRAGRNAYGPRAVHTAQGTRAFHDGTQHLRAELSRRGWVTPRDLHKLERFDLIDVGVPWNHLEMTGLILNLDLQVGVSLVRGDDRTGMIGYPNPQPASPRGYSTRSYVQQNFLKKVPKAKFDWWFAVHLTDEDHFAAEFSLPLNLTPEGSVGEWSCRVELDVEGTLPGQPSVAMAPPPSGPPTGLGSQARRPGPQQILLPDPMTDWIDPEAGSD